MITLRKLDKSEKPALDELIHVVENNLINYHFWLPIDNVSRKHYFDDSWTLFFGAFINNRLVSAIGLFLNKHEYSESQKAIGYENKKIAEVGRAMTHPDCRGNHYSSLIMEELLNHALSLNLDALIATAHPKNIPSQKLLKKYGFVKKGSIIKNKEYERDILIRGVVQ